MQVHSTHRIDPDTKQLTLRLGNALPSCELARVSVGEYLAAYAPSPKAIYEVEIALEEVLMNQIWHAYAGKLPNTEVIQLAVRVVNETVELEFSDNGIAFNPLAQQTPRFPSNIEDAVPGGLGIHLIRQYAKALDYRRDGETNTLTISLALH